MMASLPVSDRIKLGMLSSLARILRLRFVKGRVTISEFIFRGLKPTTTITSFNVCGRPVCVDLAQQELRYVYFGAFERGECRFLRRFLRSTDVAIDVGANYGFLSAVMLCNIGYLGAVHAFEPNPEVYGFLTPLQNASNGVLKTYPIAVADTSSSTDAEKIRFRVDREHSMWSGIVSKPWEAVEEGVILVRTVSLSDFIQNNGIDRVDFIKIDVEGAESKVLTGLIPILTAEFCPTIMCELVPSGESWTSTETLSIIRKLLLLGYRTFGVLDSGKLFDMPFDAIRELRQPSNIIFITETELRKRSSVVK